MLFLFCFVFLLVRVFALFGFTRGGVHAVRAVKQPTSAIAWLESQTAEQAHLPLGSGNHMLRPNREE